jgi:hypothetical protein
MKKTFYLQLSVFVLLNVLVIFTIQAQTCENSGIGTNAPASKLHIVGCTNTSSTSSLRVANSSNPTPLFFVRDDGKIGIGTSNPNANSILDINGWQYLRDLSGGLPMIMWSGNSYAPKNLGMHFDGNGTSTTAPTNEFRLGRYNKSNDLWEANPLRLSMNAPDGSLLMDYVGNIGVGLGSTMPTYKFQVRGPVVNAPLLQYGQVASFQDNTGSCQTFFSENTANSSWNPLTIAGDNGIYWTDDANIEANNGLVIAPHSGKTNGIRINGNGKVGVGVAIPVSRFQVDHRWDETGQVVLLNQPDVTWSTIPTYNAYRYIQTATSATDNGNSLFKAFHVGAGGVAIGYANTPGYNSGDALYVNGAVGIGTNSPSNPLHVTSANEWGILMRSSNNASAIRNNILIQRSNGTSAVTTNFNLGGLSIGGFDGTNYGSGWNGGAEIIAYAKENWTASARGTCLGFATTATGTASGVERMRIDHNGNVGIGTQAPVSRLEVNGSFACKTTTPAAGSFPYTLSDETIVIANVTSNATFTVNLPSPVGINGRIYIIKRVTTGAVTGTVVVVPTVGQLDGSIPSKTLADKESLTVVSNGSSWFIIN